MMDCILELSSFIYILSILIALIAAGRLYDNYSLTVSQHLREYQIEAKR